MFSSQLELQDKDETAYLKLSGDVTIQHIQDVKVSVLEGFEACHTLVLDLAGVEAIDLPALQLFCSAHRTAATSGKTLRLLNEEAEVVSEARKAAGFSPRPSCVEAPSKSDCIWDKPNLEP